MPLPTSTTFISAAVIAATLTVYFLPLQGQQSTPPTAPASQPKGQSTPNRSDAADVVSQIVQEAIDNLLTSPKDVFDERSPERNQSTEDKSQAAKTKTERLKKLIGERIQKEFAEQLGQHKKKFWKLGELVKLNADTKESFEREAKDWAEKLRAEMKDRTLSDLDRDRFEGFSLVRNQLVGLKSEHEQDETTRELLLAYDKDAKDNPDFIKQLSSIVSKQFDVKHAAREQELKQLEEQLNKLRTLHEQRTKLKTSIIEDRVRQLMSEAAGLGWGGEDFNRLGEKP